MGPQHCPANSAEPVNEYTHHLNVLTMLSRMLHLSRRHHKRGLFVKTYAKASENRADSHRNRGQNQEKTSFRPLPSNKGILQNTKNAGILPWRKPILKWIAAGTSKL
jgi:carotenoid cleavage dioxygenase-like enzyme